MRVTRIFKKSSLCLQFLTDITPASRFPHLLLLTQEKSMSGNTIHTKNRDRARSDRNREDVIQRSPLQARRHAFTGQTFLMTAEDFEAYQRLTNDFTDELKPQGFLEQNLVQFLIDTSWRLNRIPALERRLLAIDIP